MLIKFFRALEPSTSGSTAQSSPTQINMRNIVVSGLKNDLTCKCFTVVTHLLSLSTIYPIFVPNTNDTTVNDYTIQLSMLCKCSTYIHRI